MIRHLEPHTGYVMPLRLCPLCAYILTVLCVCQVDSAYASGDLVGAQIASRTARSWNVAAIVFGSITISVAIIANFIWIPIVVVASASDDY